LEAMGGKSERRGTAWRLTWPSGEQVEEAVFTAEDARALPSSTHLTLSDRRVRELVERLPRQASGQPIAISRISGLPAEVRGFWSLWRISLVAETGLDEARERRPEADLRASRILPVFLHDDGRTLAPT